MCIRDSHERACLQDRVSQAAWQLLTDIVDLDHVGNALDRVQVIELAMGLELVFQLNGMVEVVLDRTLATSRHHQDALDAGIDGLLHHVLDGRLVDDRQHLLGLRFGQRQEACPHAGYRDDRFADSRILHHALCALGHGIASDASVSSNAFFSWSTRSCVFASKRRTSRGSVLLERTSPQPSAHSTRAPSMVTTLTMLCAICGNFRRNASTNPCTR